MVCINGIGWAELERVGTTRVISTRFFLRLAHDGWWKKVNDE